MHGTWFATYIHIVTVNFIYVKINTSRVINLPESWLVFDSDIRDLRQTSNRWIVHWFVVIRWRWNWTLISDFHIIRTSFIVHCESVTKAVIPIHPSIVQHDFVSTFSVWNSPSSRHSWFRNIPTSMATIHVGLLCTLIAIWQTKPSLISHVAYL